ncbi:MULTISPECIES: hypothetical protein [unclassified Flavobacterium]|uniref:hypothetical protein n=1 Tax=unclassified Flavobacterium TaxID=196869 RepID=UPI000F0BDDD1|nr:MULTISPECIES: hypothetical protein [unclassified Flavobacterium]AYN05384.1 hypothetical protein EAG11_15445 [Flavobacterium sp. 140616W15]MCD0473465.1 hypothetical protein [Flavobacterium sp. EDS]
MKTFYKISRAIQTLLKTDAKRIFGVIQTKRINTNEIKGKLYSSESNSLLFQMYAHEDEDLFI